MRHTLSSHSFRSTLLVSTAVSFTLLGAGVWAQDRAPRASEDRRVVDEKEAPRRDPPQRSQDRAPARDAQTPESRKLEREDRQDGPERRGRQERGPHDTATEPRSRIDSPSRRQGEGAFRPRQRLVQLSSARKKQSRPSHGVRLAGLPGVPRRRFRPPPPLLTEVKNQHFVARRIGSQPGQRASRRRLHERQRQIAGAAVLKVSQGPLSPRRRPPPGLPPRRRGGSSAEMTRLQIRLAGLPHQNDPLRRRYSQIEHPVRLPPKRPWAGNSKMAPTAITRFLMDRCGLYRRVACGAAIQLWT